MDVVGIMETLRSILPLLLAISFSFAVTARPANSDELAVSNELASDVPAFRGPVDLVLLDNDRFAVSANELSSSLSLIELSSGSVLSEISLPARPVDIAVTKQQLLVVTCSDAGQVVLLQRDGRQLTQLAAIDVGFLPSGLAVTSTGGRAFVSLMATGEVAELDLNTQQLIRKFPVGKWPRYLALTHDDTRLAVGVSGESRISILSTESGEELHDAILSGGVNFGQMQMSASGEHVYFPWMIYRTNPINVRNIRLGWVLASRIARINVLEEEYREAISLDVPGQAVADPHGIAITPDQQKMACTSAGTHELLVYRLSDLPFVGAGGPGDLIDRELQRDAERFWRIPLGGRPLGVVPSSNGQTVVVANHTRDMLQIVDLEARRVIQEISLGRRPTDEQELLVHQGREIFHDATRSLDQWYSCQSCHVQGGTNSKAMDTFNDGTAYTTKTVLPLYSVTRTEPWTWHGWQTDLDASLQNSFVSTMQGEPATAQEIEALRAYMDSLELPPNPFRIAGELSPAAQRGQKVFEQAGCVDCHAGQRFSDGEIHDVGLGSKEDKYDGFNTPSLVGVYMKPRLLHDGRSKSLESVLQDWHRPEDLGAGLSLTEEQIADLVQYLKSL